MKVLHVITGLGVGGAELQLRGILQQTRHDADVVTLYNPGPVADMIRVDGTGVRSLEMHRNTELPALLRLRRIIRAGRYDVVHTHLYRSQVYGRPAAWLARTPVILSTEHSIGETHLERRKMTSGVQALYLATGMFSDITIAVSAAVRERMLKWGVRARKLTVIPNGVDLDRVAFDAGSRDTVRAELGLSPSDYVVLLLGRLDQNKRFDKAIEAAAPSLGDGTKVLVVGGGSERDHLEETARRCGVADSVVFAGERHDVAAVLSAADLLVASSAQETFGLCVLEALANGLRVLYTTCPALDGIETRMASEVPIGDLGDAIAAAISEGHVDRKPEQAVADEFGIAAVTARIDDLYERLGRRRSWRTAGRRSGQRWARHLPVAPIAPRRSAGTAASPVPGQRSGPPRALASAAPAHSPARSTTAAPTGGDQT